MLIQCFLVHIVGGEGVYPFYQGRRCQSEAFDLACFKLFDPVVLYWFSVSKEGNKESFSSGLAVTCNVAGVKY